MKLSVRLEMNIILSVLFHLLINWSEWTIIIQIKTLSRKWLLNSNKEIFDWRTSIIERSINEKKQILCQKFIRWILQSNFVFIYSYQMFIDTLWKKMILNQLNINWLIFFRMRKTFSMWIREYCSYRSFLV